MEEIRNKIMEKLRDAFIAPDELELWSKALATMDEQSLGAIQRVLETDSDSPRILTDNLKAKRAAIRSNDRDQWDRILESEKQYLQTFVPSIQ